MKKLKILFIPNKFTYVAHVSGNIKRNQVKIKATVKKMVTVEMDFLLEHQSDNTTRVTETVSFTSFLPVKAIMGRIFRQQHYQLFANIEKLA